MENSHFGWTDLRGAGHIAVPYGLWRARNAGFPAAASLTVLACSAAALALGSKGLYLVETVLFPFDDYVPTVSRHWAHGFRIPGGVVLMAVTAPLVCRTMSLPWRSFGDATIGAFPLALIGIRLGCFVNGCCFGAPSDLHWAVRFPNGSWPYYHQLTHGLVDTSASASLPIHPLQLYFVAAAAVAFLWTIRRHPQRSGTLQFEVYLLFFATTAFIEPFRANFLMLNAILLLVACLGAGAVLFAIALSRTASTNAPVAILSLDGESSHS